MNMATTYAPSEALAKSVGKTLGIDFHQIDLKEFTRGLAVELEHGLADPETNVTDSNPWITGKIAWAHLKEIPDYYTRLTAMEHEAENNVSTPPATSGSS